MPKIKQGKECCGCTACKAICPKGAIKMVPDGLGFKFPEIDYDKCIECGACERVCSFNENYKTPDNFDSPIPYGVRLKDLKEVMKSRSGGAFVAFSDWILEHGGVVYGTGYKDHFVVVHKRVFNKEGRDELRGSKYVQSDLDDTFENIKKDLKDGLWVLFSGTGCQVAGLKSYIPKPLQQKLLTVDIVCHGVPSPNIWKDFLSYEESKFKKKIIGVNFRDKEKFGWKDHKETLRFIDNTEHSSNIYTYLFYQHIMLRPSCEECHFCNIRRSADLTLADFWGWEKTGSHINDDNRGLSLILVSTQKGKEIFDDVRDKFDMITPRIEDCMQGHLKHPTDFNPLSQIFKEDYEKRGFCYVVKKYGNISWQYKLKHFAGRIIRKILNVIKH